MGTHDRLGLQSRVHELRGLEDIFRLIARHAGLRTTDWLARPLPKELPTLRLHLRLEHGELLATRKQRDDALVTNRALAQENERLRRQLDSERAQHARQLQGAARRAEEADVRFEEVREDAAVWRQQQQHSWEQQRKADRREAAQQLRKQNCELTQMWAAERQQRFDAEALHIDELEAMSGDRRDELVRLAAERDAAEAAAADFERQYREQQAAAERLRSARNGSALERQAALEAELREAKRRRSLNQRRMSDANLADKRWRTAQGQLDSLREQLAEYMIEDEAQRARATQATTRSSGRPQSCKRSSRSRRSGQQRSGRRVRRSSRVSWRR